MNSQRIRKEIAKKSQRNHNEFAKKSQRNRKEIARNFWPNLFLKGCFLKDCFCHTFSKSVYISVYGQKNLLSRARTL